MIMDGKDTESDLHALKRLYGLVKKEGTPDQASDLLDERARLLLKNLLDEATKRVLEVPSEELTTEQLSTQKLPRNAEGTQNDKDVTTSWKQKGVPPNFTQLNKDTVLESGPGYRKKRCRVCQRDTVKQVEHIEEAQFYDAVQYPDGFSDQQNSEFDRYPWNSQKETGYLSSNNATVEAHVAEERNYNFEPTGKADCLSEEASNAIKQIELCISAFHIGSDDHFHKLNKVCVVDKMEPGNWIMSRKVSVPTRIDNVQDFTWAQCENQGPPNIMGAIQKPSRLLVVPWKFREKDRHSKNRNYITAARTSSDGTRTDSNSSNWRSQQTRSGDSDSEEYSLSNDSEELPYVTSSVSSASETPSPMYSSYTSNSDDSEVYSSTSSEAAREATSGTSGKSQGFSSKKSANRMKHKKESGVWRKMKDKLAIIFHHHHHHHHHHHNHDGKKMSRNLSVNKRKAFNFKRREEACGERAVEKMSKSLINDKKQQKHFHGLVEGLMKHAKQSKKSKPEKNAFGKKKSLTKSHWWQLLHHHHKRAQFRNKTHMKLGLAKKRTRLKALPDPK